MPSELHFHESGSLILYFALGNDVRQVAVVHVVCANAPSILNVFSNTLQKFCLRQRNESHVPFRGSGDDNCGGTGTEAAYLLLGGNIQLILVAELPQMPPRFTSIPIGADNETRIFALVSYDTKRLGYRATPGLQQGTDKADRLDSNLYLLKSQTCV